MQTYSSTPVLLASRQRTEVTRDASLMKPIYSHVLNIPVLQNDATTTSMTFPGRQHDWASRGELPLAHVPTRSATVATPVDDEPPSSSSAKAAATSELALSVINLPRGEGGTGGRGIGGDASHSFQEVTADDEARKASVMGSSLTSSVEDHGQHGAVGLQTLYSGMTNHDIDADSHRRIFASPIAYYFFFAVICALTLWIAIYFSVTLS